MPHTVYGQVSLAVLVGLTIAALMFGDRKERLGAGVLVVGAALSILAQRLSGALDPAVALSMTDGLIMAGLVALSWRSRAGWPFAAVACQGTALGVHAIRLLTHGMPAWTYLTALAATTYGVMATLAFGVWRAHRLRRRRQILGFYS